MNYLYGVGQDAAPSPAAEHIDLLRKVDAQTRALLTEQAYVRKHRRIALVVSVGAAVFAAARLGIIAVPLIRAHRTKKGG